jgi:hypothetical protein
MDVVVAMAVMLLAAAFRNRKGNISRLRDNDQDGSFKFTASRLGGVMVSLLATGPKVRGFQPADTMEF